MQVLKKEYIHGVRKKYRYRFFMFDKDTGKKTYLRSVNRMTKEILLIDSAKDLISFFCKSFKIIRDSKDLNQKK